MKIVGIHAQDHYGVGGALRGLEMGEALRRMGHEIVGISPTEKLHVSINAGMSLDAVILAGTWHQLAAGHQFPLLVADACDKRNIPCIWWYGSNGSVFGSVHPDEEVRRAHEKSVIDLIAQRHFIGVICPYSIEIYKRHGLPVEKMRLVPSVFDGDLFCPSSGNDYDRRVSERLKYKFGIPPGAFCLGTIGHTPNSKGGDEILSAMSLLKDEMPDLHYVILHTPQQLLSKVRAKSPDGKKEGRSEAEVLLHSQELAAAMGLRDRVHFIGARFPREAMPMFYRLIDVYCSPSKAENLGQPLVESQLCGIPLVTYKGFSFDFVACPQTSEQIAPDHTETDDYGLIIPFANPRVLADAIRRARVTSADPAKRDATRRWTLNRFHHPNAKTMIDTINEYQGLLNA